MWIVCGKVIFIAACSPPGSSAEATFKSTSSSCNFYAPPTEPWATQPATHWPPTVGPTRASDLWSSGRSPRRVEQLWSVVLAMVRDTSSCLSVNKMYVFVALRSPEPPEERAYITRPLSSIFMRFPGVDLLRLMLLSAQCARACPGCQWGINSWFHALLIDSKGSAKIPTTLRENVIQIWPTTRALIDDNCRNSVKDMDLYILFW